MVRISSFIQLSRTGSTIQKCWRESILCILFLLSVIDPLSRKEKNLKSKFLRQVLVWLNLYHCSVNVCHAAPNLRQTKTAVTNKMQSLLLSTKNRQLLQPANDTLKNRVLYFYIF